MTTIRNRSQIQSARYDWGLLSITVALLAFGLVMVFSASYARGIAGFEDPYYFVGRQVLWSVVGVAALIIAARIPYTFWERWSVVLMGAAVLGLMAVIPFGADLYGAKRTFFGGSVQPSEPAKIITILYASAWLASKGMRIRDVRAGLLPFSMLMGIVAVLIILQPEISAAILIVATASIMFFIAGAELKQIALIGIGAGLTFWLIITNSSYAGGRLERYLDSLSNPLQSSEYQVQRSVEALVRGGPAGQGVGNSLAHVADFFLPLSWSDNIFAIVGEELGLLGALLLIFLFALLAYRGLRIALRAPDNFGMLTALGITSLLILQALLNIAVVVAASPPTGVTLPFISYGGSSLVTALGAIGILLSISYHGGRTVGKGTDSGKVTYARFDFGWRNRGARLSRPGRRRPVAQAARSRGQ